MLDKVNVGQITSILIGKKAMWHGVTTNGATSELQSGPDPSEGPLRVHSGPHYLVQGNILSQQAEQA